MRLTQQTVYALGVLIYVGTNVDRLVTIQEIAGVFSISNAPLMIGG